MLRFSSAVLFALIASSASAQFTLQDTLRGSVTPERAWWDLTYYHLDIAVDIEGRALSGTNEIRYRVVDSTSTGSRRMQIDLQEPMQIDAVEQNTRSLNFERVGNVYYIETDDGQEPGSEHAIHVAYSGQPREAVNPPWDGGLTWTADQNGNPFVATSVQGLGASAWWPNKDHMYDEPDSMLMSVRVPGDLINVSNGRLRSVDQHDDGTHTFHWFVSNPINNYGVNINIGDYVHWHEVYAGEKGPLDFDFYVLRDNLEKARSQFRQAHSTMRAFEYWFGPYPFYEDGFKLVEVPYLGMEHQSSVTYGNRFGNGYLGRDLSGTGWGLEWDYIIVHEAGHEWFANSITYQDIADMWVHEGFTAYSENLFIDYHFGKSAAAEYNAGVRAGIQNVAPIIGPYGVNQRGSGDMYMKGANMLHMIRTLLDDDEQWRTVLRGLNETFYHQTVTTEQIESYMIEHTGLDLRPVFDQYLRDHRLPTLEYEWDGQTLRFRWTDVIPSFDMPVKILVDDRSYHIHPTTSWSAKPMEASGTVLVDPNYYVLTSGS